MMLDFQHNISQDIIVPNSDTIQSAVQIDF